MAAAVAPAAPALRKPQLEALAAIASHIKVQGQRRLLTVLPTGVGKTMTFAQSPRYLRVFAGLRIRKVLVLAHREELLKQAAGTFARCAPRARIGLHKGDARCAPEAYDVVVASVQSISRVAHLAAYPPSTFDMIVIDEAHHATEESSYARVMTHFRAFEQDGPLTLGWTATPNRGDGRSLRSLFEDVPYARSLEWCIRNAYLVPPFYRPVPIDADLMTIGGKGREFSESALASMMDQPAITYATLARYRQETARWQQEHGRPHKTIAFAVTRLHAQHIVDACGEMGISAQYLGGDLPTEDREQRLRDFANDKFEMLVSVNLLLEGFDQPDVTCAVDLKPTRSLVLATQELGRILRLHPGKEAAVYLQAVPEHAEAAGMIRVPDLFNLEIDDSPTTAALLERVPMHELASTLGEAREAAAVLAALDAQFGELAEPRAWTAAEREAVIDRMLATTPEAIMQLADTLPPTFKASDVLWHARADGVFVVDLGDDLTLEVQPPDLLGRAEVVAGHGTQREVVTTGATLDEARRLAERWLIREHPDASRLVLKSQAARWMARAATEGQRARLRILAPEMSPQAMQRMTRGVAHHLINHFTMRATLRNVTARKPAPEAA